MSARASRGPNATIVAENELLADRRARRLPRLVGRQQPHSRPDQERLDGRYRNPESRSQLGIAHAAHLAQKQNRTLLFGKPLDVDYQSAQGVSLFGQRRRTGLSALGVIGLGEQRERAPELIDAPVVGHPVKPSLQGQVTVAGAQAGVGALKDILQRVLGILAAPGQHLPGVGEKPLAIAVVDDAERLVVARSKQGHQLLVGPEAEERTAQPARSLDDSLSKLESGGFHY